MQTLLIVDDEEINRLTLEAGFKNLYIIKKFDCGQQALDYIMSGQPCDAVLLDLIMPGMGGCEVLSHLYDAGITNKIPVFIVTASTNDALLLEVYTMGAVDVVSKSYNIRFMQRRVANVIELYHQRNNLQKVVEEKTQELIRQNNRLVEAMAEMVEFRSKESGLHVKRVRGYTMILLRGLVENYEEYSYLANDIENIAFASCLHDLGKNSIPDNILNKPGRLDSEEFDLMKSHTTRGYDHVIQLKDIMDPRLYSYSLDIVRHHHERYDGRGYPDKLSGDEISIWSQIVALADVYDALTTERCYKKAYDNEVAVKMIMDGECGVFNPKVIDVFDKLKDECNSFRLSLEEE